MPDDRLFCWTTLLPPETVVQVRGIPRTLVPTSPENNVHLRWEDTPPGRNDRSHGIADFSGASNHSLSEWPHQYTFAVLPSFDDPRWFIPLGNRQITRSALDLYQPIRKPARIAKHGLSLAVKTPIPWWHGRMLTLALAQPLTIDKLAQHVLGPDRYAFAILPGHPNNRGKLTAGVFSPNGTLRSIVKAASDAGGKARLQNEIDALTLLQRTPSTSELAPKLIASESRDDRLMTVQSILSGVTPKDEWTSSHDRFLAEMPAGPKKPLWESGIVRRLRQQLTSERGDSAYLLDALNSTLADIGDIAIPTVLSHGDFAPWNLRATGATLRAFDWEFADASGLPEFDRNYYSLQVGRLLFRNSDEVLLSELEATVMKTEPPCGMRVGFAVACLAAIAIAARHPEHSSSPPCFSVLLAGLKDRRKAEMP